MDLDKMKMTTQVPQLIPHRLLRNSQFTIQPCWMRPRDEVPVSSCDWPIESLHLPVR